MTTNPNLASLLADAAAADPHATALICGDRSIDYATVDTVARMFAGALADLGVQPGERIALMLPNVPQFTVAYFGALYAGAVVVPLNPTLTAAEIAYHLQDSESCALVVWEAFVEEAQGAAEQAPSVRHRIVCCADLADASAPEGWSNLVGLVASAQPAAAPHTAHANDTAVMIYTSGTTGRPKGAELTHANLAFNAQACREVVALGPDTVALATLPLFHAFGMTVMHNAVLAARGTVVLLPRFDAVTALGLMARHQATLFGGVPTMFAALLDAAGNDRLDSLQWCVSGGAAMPPALRSAFEGRFGVALLEGYGLTEASPVVSFTDPAVAHAEGCVGRPIPGVEVRLVDGGEIAVRGPGVMKGYWRRPEATAAALVDGWLLTGDIGAIDDDGALRILDRKKDVIIRGGFNVYPAEVEAALREHPAVAMAAVVGVADDRMGQEVMAVVTLRPGRSTSTAEITAFCRRRLAPYKRPRIVEIRDSLPIGPTGKVIKTNLARRWNQPAAS